MFRRGEVALDTSGKPIQAHGGGFLYDAGTYYWYGEDKSAPNIEGGHQVQVIGVHCYSSPNLIDWTDEGIVLSPVTDNPSHDLYVGNVLERPKVVKCGNTYVLWAHIESPDYRKASLGVATSDSPTGPFVYRHSLRPGGHDSRDMTLFQAPDGATYVFFSSEGFLPGAEKTTWNATQRIARLTDDGLLTVGEPAVAFPGEHREAPAVFAWGGKFWQITSGCTGWHPNPARWHVADHPLGPWTTGGDPCVGDINGTTFDSQSTFVLPLPGQPDEFLFCADRWKPENLQDSRYVWLPLSMATGQPVIRWEE